MTTDQAQRVSTHQDPPQAATTPAGGGVTTEQTGARQRRRPMVLIVCVALVVLGALLSVVAFNASTSTVEVLVVRDTVERGELIEESNLRAAEVSVDASVATIPAAEAGRVVVGRRAALDIPKGGFVTQESIATGTVPRAGESVVGVTLPASQLPGEPLEVGDQVRVVDAPGVNGGAAASARSGEGGAAADPREVSVEVAGVRVAGENTTVSVIVDESQAGPLAARAATGRVVIVLDSRER